MTGGVVGAQYVGSVYGAGVYGGAVYGGSTVYGGGVYGAGAVYGGSNAGEHRCDAALQCSCDENCCQRGDCCADVDTNACHSS